MSNLEKYINNVKQYKNQHPNLSELELIRYVYLDLGKRFSFDVNFLPFSNGKKKQKIYRKGTNVESLDECMESNIVICKSAAYILEYVLKVLGIDISTVVDPDDHRKFPHVYNIIKLKDEQEFTVDLQEDMYNIQSHSFTKGFGLSPEDRKTLVIPKLVQEQVDRKLGYISDENYYANDYLYLLKYDIGFIEDFGERVKHVLENIDIYDNPNMQYTDRQWHHVRVLEELFSSDEFNYDRNNRKIRMIDCYKDVNGERKYVNCIAVQTKRGTEIYVYNKKEYRYSQISLKNFARAVKNGLVLHECSVPGLRGALNQLKNKEKEIN